MDHQIFLNSDHSQFRADEEDVLAYVQSIIRHTNKQEILNWVKELPEQEIQSMIIPFMSEKMTKEIAEKEY